MSRPCNGVEDQICSKAIMLTMSGLNHLFQSLGAVTLSAASQAVLQSTCRTCRNAQRLPWYVVLAILEVVILSSSLISDLAGRHGDMPDTARAFSGLAQAYQAPSKKFERGPPATSEQVQHPGSCFELHAALVFYTRFFASCLAHLDVVGCSAQRA